MRKEKESDKSMIQENKLIITFDFENLISLPKAEDSSFLYKRKQNLYNLTAITSHKQGYCAIWTALTTGRAELRVASAFTAILKKIVADNPNKTDFICWSDGFFSQIRSLRRTPTMKSITLKYSTALYSCVQDVNNMHKQIEDVMRGSKVLFFSVVFAVTFKSLPKSTVSCHTNGKERF